MKWYEDFEVGETEELGTHLFTAEEIVDFAKDFDPQPFHLSDEAAAKSLFGRLAASGWHTASIFMKLNVAGFERQAAERRARGDEADVGGPSPGFENMRWPKPVLAGDSVTYLKTVVDKRTSASRPGWGIVRHHTDGFNQNGDKVFEFDSNVFVRRRETGAA